MESSTPAPTPSSIQTAFHSRENGSQLSNLSSATHAVHSHDFGGDASFGPIHKKRFQPSPLRSSKSSPGLTHMLRHKLSNAFMSPTVVHKPNMRSRPSLQSLYFEPGVALPARGQELSPIGTTDPSSAINSWNASSPVGPYSTGKTSVSSELSKQLSDPRVTGREFMTKRESVSAALDSIHAGSLTPIPEAPPTIVPCTCDHPKLSRLCQKQYCSQLNSSEVFADT